jgi:hypothetical protein
MSQAFKQYCRDLFARFDKGTITEYQLATSLKAYAWATSGGLHG